MLLHSFGKPCLDLMNDVYSSCVSSKNQMLKTFACKTCIFFQIFCIHKSHENSSSSLVLNCFCWHNLTCFFIESDHLIILSQYSQTWDWSSCLDMVCFLIPDLVKNCWLHLSHSNDLVILWVRTCISRYCFVTKTFAHVAHEYVSLLCNCLWRFNANFLLKDLPQMSQMIWWFIFPWSCFEIELIWFWSNWQLIQLIKTSSFTVISVLHRDAISAFLYIQGNVGTLST